MTDDVVAALDRWLVSRASLREATVSHALLQAAREEIVALRAFKARVFADVRAEALEEAARVAEHWQEPYSSRLTPEGAAIAAAIRALKDKQHD